MWKFSSTRLVPALVLLFATTNLAKAQLTLLPSADGAESVPLTVARMDQPASGDTTVQRSTLELHPVLLPDSPSPTPDRTTLSETEDYGEKSSTTDSRTPTTTAGCVLLKNDNVLFGDAVQVGQFVVVKTGSGGEVRLPRTQVACWANSLRDLYQYRRDHRQEGNLADHLRDARWCLRFELLDLAANELRAVYRIDPENRQAALIEERLRRRAENDNANLAETTSSKEDDTQDDVQTVQFESESSSDRTLFDDPLVLRRFASHIQPLLMNRCGNCHSEHPTGKAIDVRWLLTKPSPGTRPSADITRANLESIVPYLDFDNLRASELLRFATASHGGGDAPLGRLHSKAITSLEQWIELVRARQNGSKNRNAMTVRADSPPQSSVTLTSPGKELEAAESWPEASPQPARLPQVSDPFDPELFNRRFHRD